METAIDRPAVLRDAAAAIAYQRWLQQNGFEDSDVNAWRFAAQAGQHSSDTQPPAQKPSQWSTRTRWWIPAVLAVVLLVATGAVAAYAWSTAHYWTKIDQPESSHTEMVPNGTWHVTHDNKEICYVGQLYWDCIGEYTAQWNYACAHRAHDVWSRQLCENYYDVIQDMKAGAAGNEYGIVAETAGSGRLSIRENLDRVRVIDRPELSHEAVCYLGFIGECPPPPPAQNPATRDAAQS